jgi:hypothetical protein
MFIRPGENAAETFLTLLREANLPEPDDLIFDDVNWEVTFLWHERRTAVIVDLDGFKRAA